MGKYIEVFVAFDVAKKKHAVAIAEGEKSVSRRRREQPVADRAGRRDTGFIGRSSRARTRSRTASWAASGVHTPVSSPARCSGFKTNMQSIDHHAFVAERLETLRHFL
jgi:hypothetical protein